MITVGSKAASIPTGLTPQRARQWALFRTLRDLRLSVARGRPITLPNLLRLYSRRTGALAVASVDRYVLRDTYLLHQPFKSTLPKAQRSLPA